MNTTINSVAKPTANLTINKSRLKIDNSTSEPTYYLKNGQEFQLELFNPTRTRVLAKIKLNGNLISQGGIVLRPGERIFLERYLDVAKKFLFETYEVDSEDSDVKAAIQNNGAVEVDFYDEDVTPEYLPLANYPYNYNTYTYYNGNLNGTGGILGGNITTCGGIVGQTTTNTNINCSNTASYDSLLSFSSSCVADASNSLAGGPTQSNSKSILGGLRGLKKTKVTPKVETKATIETGRIESGGSSSQTLKTVNYKFNYWASSSVKYKILPLSEKINTIDDLKVKLYCHECGTKLSKGHKFCSNCGTKQ